MNPHDTKGLLTRAWRNVPNDVKTGCVVSEHTLQACFYHHLRSDPASGTRRIFVEPRLGAEKEGRPWVGKIPDIVITDGQEIAAFVEIKFGTGPGGPNCKYDLGKLGDYGGIGEERVYLDLVKDGSYDSENASYRAIGAISVFAVLGPDDYWLFDDKAEIARKHVLLLGIGCTGEPKRALRECNLEVHEREGG
jgi:hypothetical protein